MYLRVALYILCPYCVLRSYLNSFHGLFHLSSKYARISRIVILQSFTPFSFRSLLNVNVTSICILVWLGFARAPTEISPLDSFARVLHLSKKSPIFFLLGFPAWNKEMSLNNCGGKIIDNELSSRMNFRLETSKTLLFKQRRSCTLRFSSDKISPYFLSNNSSHRARPSRSFNSCHFILAFIEDESLQQLTLAEGFQSRVEI